MDNTQIEKPTQLDSSVQNSLEVIDRESILEKYENIFQQQQEQIDFLTQELERLKHTSNKTKSQQKNIFSLKRIWRNFMQYVASIYNNSSSFQPQFSVTQILVSYFYIVIRLLKVYSSSKGKPKITFPLAK